MTDCIVCKKPLSDTELALNMNFHNRCCRTIIKEAWNLLESQDKEKESLK